METRTAILRYHKDRITVLCGMGHYVMCIRLGSHWGGSMDQVEVSAYQNGEPNRFDRLAAKCQGYGHAPGERLPAA